MSKFKGARPKPAKFGQPSSAASSPESERLPPVFSFENMAGDTGYSVECCDSEHRAALVSKLFTLSRMTWFEIKNAHRHGLGTEKIDRGSIRCPIPLKVSEDVTLLAIRYNGMHPMVGYRDGRIFYILFLDQTMDLYNHGS